MRKIATSLFSALVVSFAASASTENTATFDWFEYRGNDPIFEQPLAKDEYRNPILAGYYPDPSIVQVEDDYYLVNSSFAHYPGIPLFHSRDLVNWTQLGHVIDRPDQLDFSGLGISRGVFAPAITYNEGTFYLVTTCVDCGGNFVVTAKNPAGPWSDPVWLPEVGGIDPSLFFDDDGKAYIINNDAPIGEPLYDGHRALWVQEFDAEKLATVGPRKLVVNGGVNLADKPVWIEGPHLFRKDGQLYLIAAEGGTSVNHSQVVLKGESPFGPFTPWDKNPILTQRHLDPDRPNPVTSVGHADFVQDAEDNWWAVFLGIRPYEGDFYNTGRETFLMPVSWEDGWPVITRGDQRIPMVAKRPALPPQQPGSLPLTGNFTQRDEFDSPFLPMHWLQLRNPSPKPWLSLERAPGSLQLTATATALADIGNPAFVGRRQQHLHATATTRMRYQPQQENDRAGMAVFQNREHFYFFGVTGNANGGADLIVTRRDGEGEQQGTTVARRALATRAGKPADIQLQVTARGAEYDFHYRLDSDKDWQPLLLAADGKVVSTRNAGGFVGALIGLHAYRAEP